MAEAELSLAQQISRTGAEGDALVRLAHDWWTGAAHIDVTSVATSQAPQGSGTLELFDDLGGRRVIRIRRNSS
jgi:hypothetical protein